MSRICLTSCASSACSNVCDKPHQAPYVSCLHPVTFCNFVEAVPKLSKTNAFARRPPNSSTLNYCHSLLLQKRRRRPNWTRTACFNTFIAIEETEKAVVDVAIEAYYVVPMSCSAGYKQCGRYSKVTHISPGIDERLLCNGRSILGVLTCSDNSHPRRNLCTVSSAVRKTVSSKCLKSTTQIAQGIRSSFPERKPTALCNAAKSPRIETSREYWFCRRCNSILYKIATSLYDVHHIFSKDTVWYRTIWSFISVRGVFDYTMHQ